MNRMEQEPYSHTRDRPRPLPGRAPVTEWQQREISGFEGHRAGRRKPDTGFPRLPDSPKWTMPPDSGGGVRWHLFRFGPAGGWRSERGRLAWGDVRPAALEILRHSSFRRRSVAPVSGARPIEAHRRDGPPLRSSGGSRPFASARHRCRARTDRPTGGNRRTYRVNGSGSIREESHAEEFRVARKALGSLH